MLDEKKELLKKALLEARLNELENIPSTKSLEQEHVFSLSFEKKMKALTRRKKISTNINKAGKYVAGFAVICVLTGSAFLVMQGGGMFFNKSESNDVAMEEIVEDKENSFIGNIPTEDYYADAENIEADMESEFTDYTASTGNNNYGTNTNIVTNIYKDGSNMVIEINCAGNTALSQGIADYYITYTARDNTHLSDSDNSTSSQSGTTGAILDEKLYDLFEEKDKISYIIDSEMLLEFSRLNIYLETETDTVRFSFTVNEADGSLSLIK